MIIILNTSHNLSNYTLQQINAVHPTNCLITEIIEPVPYQKLIPQVRALVDKVIEEHGVVGCPEDIDCLILAGIPDFDAVLARMLPWANILRIHHGALLETIHPREIKE